MSDDKNYITVSKAAKEYRVSEQSLRNWIKAGTLSTVENGTDGAAPQRVDRTVLEALLSAKGKLKTPEVRAEGDSVTSIETPLTASPPTEEVPPPVSEAPNAKPEVEAQGISVAATETPLTALPLSGEAASPASVPTKAPAGKKRKRSAKEQRNPVKYVKNQMRKFTGADLVKIRDWILHRLDAEILGTKATKP